MKLSINAKFDSSIKSAVFAVSDSLNYHFDKTTLKDINVPQISSQIVAETRREYGEKFTKVNLETVLNQTVKNMSNATTKATTKPATSEKDVEVSAEDMKIVSAPDGADDVGKPNYMPFNEKIKRLSHLWNQKPLLMRLLGKSRQRVNNAIKKAKNKS